MSSCLNFWSEEQRWFFFNSAQLLETFRRGNPDYRAARRNNGGVRFYLAAHSVTALCLKSSVERCVFSFPGLLIPIETCQAWGAFVKSYVMRAWFIPHCNPRENPQWHHRALARDQSLGNFLISLLYIEDIPQLYQGRWDHKSCPQLSCMSNFSKSK